MTLVVNEDSTPAEVREAITHLANKAKRCPSHWVDRKAAIHEAINELLDQLDAMPAPSVATPSVGV